MRSDTVTEWDKPPLLVSDEPLAPPVLAGGAGLAGITALAFSNMAKTWSLEDA